MVPKFGMTVLPENMIWLPALALNDYEAQSPISYAATMLGGAYAAIEFNASSYKKGGFFKGVLTILGKIGSENKTPAQRAAEISRQFDATYIDGNTPVLYDGSTYTPINMSQRDLQFIEYMRYTVEDIARLYNVPLSKLKNIEGTVQSNMESQQLEFSTDTMQPWYEKWENELSDKLLTTVERAQGYHIAFNEKMLTAGDTAARADYYTKLFYLSSMNPNEIRRAEGYPDRDGGDQYFSGVNLFTQEQVALATEKMQKEIDGAIMPATQRPNPNQPQGNGTNNGT
jgi:HK97 family phage portal protein